jgi:hypothetical protein
MNHTVIVGIKWFTSADFSMNRTLQPPTVVGLVDAVKEDLRVTIESLLFDRGHNQCLLRWKDIVYVCDKFDTSKRMFSTTKVNYHPYMNYLN